MQRQRSMQSCEPSSVVLAHILSLRIPQKAWRNASMLQCLAFGVLVVRTKPCRPAAPAEEEL